ncbi:hypothetical protein FRX31_030233 [Thalictrum thalictroides]|uniref:Uncharacterized protein n=1 Tax=Thalictrum thalictroides TaxID=46969 RepID=A0A7J6V7K6_THATH|nr:hypothetical protein FRX31_030233 [Thalictrum thalictroides]
MDHFKNRLPWMESTSPSTNSCFIYHSMSVTVLAHWRKIDPPQIDLATILPELHDVSGYA